MSSRRLMIDGDVLRYEIGAVAMKKEVMFGETIFTPFQDHKVVSLVDDMIEKIVRRTDSDAYEVFLSGGTNYRTDIAVTDKYKGTRASAKPYHWKTVDSILREHYDAYIIHGAEADDALSIFGRQDPENTIIASRDKDLRIVPCLHYSWKCGESQPEVPVHKVDTLGWVEAKAYNSGGYKLIGCGLKFFYGQVLAGDSIDNYKGCPSCGPQGAANALSGCNSEEELWEATYWIYHKKLGPDEGLRRLLENARLAWLLDTAEVHQDDHNITISPLALWQPPSPIPIGFGGPVPATSTSNDTTS